jgi:hypothetical protein
VLEHGTKDNDEFAHDGGDGNFVGFSPLHEAFRESAEDLVVPDCGSRRHEQAGAHLAPASKDASSSALFAAVAIIRSQPGQSRGRGGREGAKLRHEGKKRVRRHGPHASQRLHELGAMVQSGGPGG